MSILLNRSTAPRTAALICSSLETSMDKAAASPPAAVISAATCCSFSWLRAARAILAPPAARRRAQARPIPCDAPVTSATRPCRPMRSRLPGRRRDYKRPEYERPRVSGFGFPLSINVLDRVVLGAAPVSLGRARGLVSADQVGTSLSPAARAVTDQQAQQGRSQDGGESGHEDDDGVGGLRNH